MGKLKLFIGKITGTEKRSFIKNELDEMGPGKIPKRTKKAGRPRKVVKNGK